MVKLVKAGEFMSFIKLAIIFLNFYRYLKYLNNPDALEFNDVKFYDLSLAYYHFFY
jgi:hypothetical protein